MELKKLFTEDRAVSPVIAVVLMIAVTVILAAVVAAFALGLGSGADSSPQASFDFDWDPDPDNDAATDDGELAITHEGGDPVEAARVTVFVNGNEDTVGAWPDTTINTGETYTTDQANNADVAPGNDVRIVWVGDDGTESTLATYTIPS
jgi:flagellin-like protein